MESYVNVLTMAPDNKTLAIGGDGKLLFWDLATKTMSRPIPDEQSVTVKSIKFMSDSSVIAAGAIGSSNVIVWNVRSGKTLGSAVAHSDAPICCVDLSGNGELLLSASYDHNQNDRPVNAEIKVWRVWVSRS